MAARMNIGPFGVYLGAMWVACILFFLGGGGVLLCCVGFPVWSERYLHEQKPCILHRDLKSSNVLLAKPLRPAWEGRAEAYR